MRYSYDFKLKCVNLYRKGIWEKTPTNVSEKTFHTKIRQWSRIMLIHGKDGLKHSRHNRQWTADEKLELVTLVLHGKSLSEVAYASNISLGMLSNWVNKYRSEGYNSLMYKKGGRPSKETKMNNKKINSKPLNKSEREELIRLRAEVEHIKAENETIKKEIALREQKHAASLKAKKQRLSKNYEKKDTN